jgi:hypothetical protein
VTTHQPVGRHAAAALALLAICASVATAQDADPEPLRLIGVSAAGTRATATESWGAIRVDLANAGTDGRDARVAVFYKARRDVQFTRDVHVPARTVVTTWATIGPVPDTGARFSRDVEVLLYDRTGGRERLILPRGEEQLVRDRPLIYRPREPTTAILTDPPGPGAADRPDSEEPLTLVRSLREAVNLSEHVGVIQERFLPPTPEAFDGIDVLVLAGNQLAADPAGGQTVRRWVQQGGTLWVLLDRVDPATVAPLLGEDFDLQVVDRVGLTTVRLHRPGSEPGAGGTHDHDLPVELVRVLPGDRDTVTHAANGWPTSFARVVGRGRVVFTTLGPRGWYRQRTARDARSRYEHFPDNPVALDPLVELGVRLHPKNEPPGAPPEELRGMVLQEVGYSVVGRWTAAAVFVGFLLIVLGLGLALRRSRRRELVGWLGPAAAVVAAVVFVALGESSRRSVPPTVACVAVVEAVPGSGEAAAYGVAAVYRPHSGPVPLRTDRGATLDLDAGGLEGQTRLRVVTDLDRWHWEGLSLPAGIRTGPFRATIRGNLSAVARFGPDGLTGRFDAGPFRAPADGLVVTPARSPLAVRFRENAFTARGEDALPPDQYLTDAVLSDRQQQRQALYRQLLGKSFPKHWEGRDLLLAWADWDELPIRVGEGDRAVGAALLVTPLEFERPPAGTRVTVPRAFIPSTRIVAGRPFPLTLGGSLGSEMELRFQLPPSVLPLAVERLRLSMKVRTPARRVTVSGHADAGLVALFDAENPLDPIVLDVTDPRLLRPDPDGGLRLTLKIGEQVMPEPPGKTPPPGKSPPTGTPKAPGREVEQFWKIESLGVEVVGRTAGR